jgi:serine protease Do
MSGTTLRAALLLAGIATIAHPALHAPAAAQPASLLPSFSGLVEATQPAVVTVRAAADAGSAHVGRVPGGDDAERGLRDFFDRFFGGEGQPGMPPPPPLDALPREAPVGLGSGFIIDAKGVIVTNYHVVEGADELTVVLDDGTELEADLVASDDKTDIAVLRVDAGRRLPTVAWGDSSTVKVGDWAIAIGNPFGLGGSVSVGIISASGRNIQSGPYDDYFQIDAPINRGNSGGPLFDQQGRVIGVNAAIFSPSGGNVGIGFAIPSNQARAVVEDLLEDGVVERGWLGVAIQQVTPAIAESLGLTRAEGAMVADVNADGPAARGGVLRGDIILDYNGTPIDTVRDLTRSVADTPPGQRATLRLLRRGDERTVTVMTGRYPS